MLSLLALFLALMLLTFHIIRKSKTFYKILNVIAIFVVILISTINDQVITDTKLYQNIKVEHKIINEKNTLSLELNQNEQIVIETNSTKRFFRLYKTNSHPYVIKQTFNPTTNSIGFGSNWYSYTIYNIYANDQMFNTLSCKNLCPINH